MPKGPKGEKRPADMIGNAVLVMRIATGEATPDRSKGAGRVSSEGVGPRKETYRSASESHRQERGRG